VSEATRDGKYDQAISALNAVLNENPRDVEALQLRSATYRRTGKTKEWIEDLKAAAALGDAYSQLNLGVYYMTGIPGVLAADRNAGKALFRQVLKQSDAEPEYAKEAQHNLETAKYQDAHPTQPIPVVEQSSPGS
jgi:TPR repeat protein